MAEQVIRKLGTIQNSLQGDIANLPEMGEHGSGLSPETLAQMEAAHAQEAQAQADFERMVREETQTRQKAGVPTWLDVYNKHKAATKNFAGKGVNAWTQDAAHMDTKRRIDQEYQAALDAYNKAKGTNYSVQDAFLGVDAQPNADWHSATNNVDQKGGVMGAALGKDWLDNAIKAGVVAGTGAVLGPATVGMLPSGGAAGAMGIAPGALATGVNTAALTTGTSLLGGDNIGDALKKGAVAGVLSPVGTAAGKGITSALGAQGLSPAVLKAIATAGGQTAIGGASAVARGKDIGQGLRSGLINGGIAVLGDLVGGQAKEIGVGTVGQGAAKTAATTALRGGDARTALLNYGLGQAADAIGVPPEVMRAINTTRGMTAAAARPKSTQPTSTSKTQQVPKAVLDAVRRRG